MLKFIDILKEIIKLIDLINYIIWKRIIKNVLKIFNL